jgi:hypothetical protein
MKPENPVRSTNHWLVFQFSLATSPKISTVAKRALGHEIREFQTEHSAPPSFVGAADDKFPPSSAFQ